ncbi:MAG: hypothetical protein QOJ67_2482 [Acidimicrobiaceae bacterium]
MIARRTVAPLPISTSLVITDASTVAPLLMMTLGDNTEWSTTAPEITHPGDTIDSWACPPSTNFAPGSAGMWL